MSQNSDEKLNQVILAIHSTDDSFGFAYRNKNKNEIDSLFIKKFDNDLCNNLIIDFGEFISRENIQQVNKIYVSTGPANFNASRLIIVLARTISQQIKCPLVGLSSFQLISRRIASNNNFLRDNQSFWIYKKLKRKGYIAGKYEVHMSGQKKEFYQLKKKLFQK